MALTTCPACGRKDVSTAADCPGCGIPVSKYLHEMPSYKDLAERDKVKCPECGLVQDLTAYTYCSKCGKKLPVNLSGYTSSWPCPRCRSPRTTNLHIMGRKRGFLESLFSKNKSYWIQSYWCHNCGHVFKE